MKTKEAFQVSFFPPPRAGGPTVPRTLLGGAGALPSNVLENQKLQEPLWEGLYTEGGDGGCTEGS